MKNNACFLHLLIRFALIMAINAAPSPTIDDGDLNETIKMYDNTTATYPWRMYPCKKPQPRAYVLSDLMKRVNLSSIGDGKTFDQPPYIVLKRCDVHSGCCSTPTSICVPVQSEIYYEKLKIYVYSLATDKTISEWLLVEQHGNCDCLLTTNTKERRELEKEPKIKRLSSREES